MDECFRLLYVCHANECRSPMAERLTRRAFADRFGPNAAQLRVTSAGTHARTGAPMRPFAALALQRAGADPAGFSSRPLSRSLADEADLVLTATREQRATCVTMAPGTLGRTFTLFQFGRMLAALDTAPVVSAPGAGAAAGMRRLLAAAVAARHLIQPPATPADDDLPDPVGRPETEFESCAIEIQRTLERMLAAIRTS